ncbi:MAG: hypothetical protein ACETV1_00885 [Candidatus Bathyarchaeia archaeon]
MAGAPFEKGRREDGLMQLVTLAFRIGGVEVEPKLQERDKCRLSVSVLITILPPCGVTYGITLPSFNTLTSVRLGRTFRILVRKFGLTVPPSDPRQLIEEYSERLNIPSKITRKAISIAQKTQERGTSQGRSPSFIAASAVYIACQEKKEKSNIRQIAKAFCTSVVTVRITSRVLQDDR